MAITKEVLQELLKDYKNPADLLGEEGILKGSPRRWWRVRLEPKLVAKHHRNLSR